MFSNNLEIGCLYRNVGKIVRQKEISNSKKYKQFTACREYLNYGVIYDKIVNTLINTMQLPMLIFYMILINLTYLYNQ